MNWQVYIEKNGQAKKTKSKWHVVNPNFSTEDGLSEYDYEKEFPRKSNVNNGQIAISGIFGYFLVFNVENRNSNEE